MLAGRRAVVLGFASQRSIAWGIAKAWHDAGAHVAIGMQSNRFRRRLEDMTSDWKRKPVLFECDVAEDAAIDDAAEMVLDVFDGAVDTVCHSVAYAPAQAMKEPLLECSREDFLAAHNISAYSFLAVARAFSPGLVASGRGSLSTLSYLGSQRSIPSYSVMGPAKASLEAVVRGLATDLGPRGVTVNAISPGPIETLAARGIRGFSQLKQASDVASALGRGVDPSDVGGMATFLASDAARSITGQTLFVDSGVSVMGPTPPAGEDE